MPPMNAAVARDFEFEALQRTIWSAANELRAVGLNPLETVEHVSLLFLLRLTQTAETGLLADLRGLAPALDSSTLREAVSAQDHPARFFTEKFYPALRAAVDEAPRESPLRIIFDGFTPRISDDRALLRSLELIEEMSVDMTHTDVNGTVYEKLVGTISDAGFLGQYFTPRHIVDAMVALVRPEPGESIYDPAAGTGGFLIRAAAQESEANGGGRPRLFGRELNAAARRLCVMNLIIHGLDPTHIEAGDSLAHDHQLEAVHDVILTNPPFGQTVTSPEVLSRFPIRARGAEALFVQHVVNALRPGGRAAIVCPEGLLTNVGNLRELRAWILRETTVEMVMSLPGGVFLPYTGVRTGVMVLRKGEPTRKVWFFDARADGFSLDVKRAPVVENDIPAATGGFSKKIQTERSVLVPIKDLERHDLRFIASRYLNRRKHRIVDHKPEPVGSVVHFRRVNVNPATQATEEFFYVGLEHVESKSGDLINVELVPGSALRSQKSRFCAGDILYGKLRPYLAKATVAPCDGICSTEILVMVPDATRADSGYLAHVLRSAAFTEEASSLMVGANHPRLHPRDLLGIEIPLPHLDEQRELMAEIGELRAKIDDAAEAIRTLRVELSRRIDALWGD